MHEQVNKRRDDNADQTHEQDAAEFCKILLGRISHKCHDAKHGRRGKKTGKDST